MDYQSRVNWHVEAGKRILVANYSELTGEHLMGVFNVSYNIQKAAGTDVLILTDFTGVKANPEIIKALKQAGVELDKDMKKIAVVGLTKMQTIFYNGYLQVTRQHKKTKLFEEQEAAIFWLLQD
ncbi:MAG: hypothetical protein NXI00_23650 [Cytophagales bacterium]|nr:hypothetical protein [Cytophagales bacterium]